MNKDEIMKKYEEIEKTVETYGNRKIYRDEKTGRFAQSPYKDSKSNGANYGARNTRTAMFPVTYHGKDKGSRRSRFVRV